MSWETELFDCFFTKDAGPLCCFNFCCCAPCVYSDALSKSNVPNAGFISVLTFLGEANNDLGTGAGFVGRRALLRKYNINESTIETCFVSCCCPICAAVQDVNTVMVKENLKYGCASLQNDTQAPQNIEMNQNISKKRIRN